MERVMSEGQRGEKKVEDKSKTKKKKQKNTELEKEAENQHKRRGEKMRKKKRDWLNGLWAFVPRNPQRQSRL